MTYTPNPDDATEPLGSVIALTASAEFRALKSKINTQSGLSTSGQTLPGIYTLEASDIVAVYAAIAALPIASLQAQINGKVSSISPIFSGTATFSGPIVAGGNVSVAGMLATVGLATSQTPTVGDNSTNDATTAFVTQAITNAALGPFPLIFKYITASQPLTGYGTFGITTAAGSFSCTLPSPAVTGMTMIIYDPDGNWFLRPLILTTSDGKQIGTASAGAVATSMTFNISDMQFTIFYNGTFWEMT